MEHLLNSKAELPNSLPARYRNGHNVIPKNIGPLAAFLWLNADNLEFSYPDLWEIAHSSMIAADAEPHDLGKAQKAWQAARDLPNAGTLAGA